MNERVLSIGGNERDGQVVPGLLGAYMGQPLASTHALLNHRTWSPGACLILRERLVLMSHSDGTRDLSRGPEEGERDSHNLVVFNALSPVQ